MGGPLACTGKEHAYSPDPGPPPGAGPCDGHHSASNCEREDNRWKGPCDSRHSASNCDWKEPAPNPWDVISTTTYGNGTTLVIYRNGRAKINGFLVAPGVVDPDALAARMDKALRKDEEEPQGTLGICGGASLQLFWVAAFDYCIVADKNGVALAVTDVTPAGGQGPGVGAGLHINAQYSPDARTKDDLGGPFNYWTASVPAGDFTYANGSTSDGHEVNVFQGGPGAAIGGGYHDGISNTTVTGYWFKWPDWMTRPLW